VTGSENNSYVSGLFLVVLTVRLRITVLITSFVSSNFPWNHFLCR